MPRTRDNGDDETNGDNSFRLSITIDPSLRRKIRLAAAVHDLGIGEWASKVLGRAADEATKDMKLPARRAE
jgi:hypothetical protein